MEQQQKILTFWDHLEELRHVLFRIAVAVVFLMLVAFLFKDELFAIVLAPKNADFIIYRFFCRIADFMAMPSLCPEVFYVKMINTQLAAQFITHMSVSFYTGFLLASPYVIYQLFRFVSPALYENEKKYSTRIVGWGYFLFMMGVLLNYFLIFPLTFRFLATYQVSMEVENTITLSSYMDTLMMMSLMMGIVFEIPVLCWLFAKLVFTYFHFACDKELTEAMMRSGSVCLAYETVTDKQGGLPLLIPMSEVAGRMSTQEGARFLEKPQGGRGILLGGVPGVKPAKVLVLGGGIVGTNAALMAAGLGADVTICDISLPRLRQLSEFMPKNVKTLFSSSHNIEKELPTTDLIIGAVLIPGAKAPHLITRPMLKLMKKGTVLVDVAIDQGGCFETSHPTTHAEPIYEVDGIIHYCVANIPGAVPCTSTLALTNATLPYAIRLADLGWEKACENDPGLKNGLNIVNGKIVFPAVAEAFGWKI